jgi:hypothetical protein
MKLLSESFDVKEAIGAVVAVALVVLLIVSLAPHLKADPKKETIATNDDHIKPFPNVKTNPLRHPFRFVGEVMAPFPAE